MSKPHVRVYLDDQVEPVIDRELPTKLDVDTRKLEDGPHRLTIRAEDQNGIEGVEEIPFHVQNGPGIMVGGLRPGSTRRGILNLTVDAFSADDPFDPRRAEARRSIPTWVWVLCLVVVAWIIFYVATMWDPPAKFANTPTFGNTPTTQNAPATGSATAAPAQPPG